MRKAETDQILRIQPVARRGVQDGAGEGLAGRHPLECRRHRRQYHPSGARGPRIEKPRQGVDAPAHDLGQGRDAIIGQAVPGRERQTLDGRRKEGQGVGGAGGAHVVAGDEQDFATLCRELSQDQGIKSLGRARNQGETGTFEYFIAYKQ